MSAGALVGADAAAPARPLWKDLAPICLMVFFEFLAMGLPLPVLPVRVHGALGFGAFVVGLVVGAQSWVTLLTRHMAGTRSDRLGPRSASALGLGMSALAGLFLAASALTSSGALSLAVMLAGRALLGVGESLVVTGALAWGVALAGRERTGVVMAWTGIAMYGAMAVGAPLGSAIDARAGFVAVALVAAFAPLLGMGASRLVAAVEPTGGSRLPLRHVAGLIWLPGLGLSLCALGFGAIAGFAILLFRDHGWPHAALAMTAFGAAFVLARLLFGRFPDRFGGARIAVASTGIALLGQVGMWLATSGGMAVAAAGLTGFGFSLAFPSFGVVAMRHVPPQSRGVALGAYAACFDATMGVGVPLLGAVAGSLGYRAAFGASALAGVVSFAVALVLARRDGRAA